MRFLHLFRLGSLFLWCFYLWCFYLRYVYMWYVYMWCFYMWYFYLWSVCQRSLCLCLRTLCQNVTNKGPVIRTEAKFRTKEENSLWKQTKPRGWLPGGPGRSNTFANFNFRSHLSLSRSGQKKRPDKKREKSAGKSARRLLARAEVSINIPIVSELVGKKGRNYEKWEIKTRK